MASLKIKRVHANKSSFREVRLHDGLNIILAERSAGSTERDSRNGVGKSTLVEIIHFCLGSSVTQKNVIYQLRDSDWAFSLDLEIGSDSVTVTRSLEAHTAVTLTGDTRIFAELSSARTSLSGAVELPLKAWKDLLGAICFGISGDASEMKYSLPIEPSSPILPGPPETHIWNRLLRRGRFGVGRNRYTTHFSLDLTGGKLLNGKR